MYRLEIFILSYTFVSNFLIFKSSTNKCSVFLFCFFIIIYSICYKILKTAKLSRDCIIPFCTPPPPLQLPAPSISLSRNGRLILGPGSPLNIQSNAPKKSRLPMSLFGCVNLLSSLLILRWVFIKE